VVAPRPLDRPLNVLVNYWWNDLPPEAGSPFEVLVHGLLAVRHLPASRSARPGGRSSTTTCVRGTAIRAPTCRES
jgi:hypothetical protein